MSMLSTFVGREQRDGKSCVEPADRLCSQGVVSVILVMEQFQAHIPRIADSHPNSGFWKGLMVSMLYH